MDGAEGVLVVAGQSGQFRHVVDAFLRTLAVRVLLASLVLVGEDRFHAGLVGLVLGDLLLHGQLGGEVGHAGFFPEDFLDELARGACVGQHQGEDAHGCGSHFCCDVMN